MQSILNELFMHQTSLQTKPLFYLLLINKTKLNTTQINESSLPTNLNDIS